MLTQSRSVLRSGPDWGWVWCFVFAASCAASPAGRGPTTPSAAKRTQVCPTSNSGEDLDAASWQPTYNCAFSDLQGEGATQLGGRVVVGEPGTMLSVGLGDAEVLVYPAAGNNARLVARAVTDAQGRFYASAFLKPGYYTVMVRAPGDGVVLTKLSISVGRYRGTNTSDLTIRVPERPAPRSPQFPLKTTVSPRHRAPVAEGSGEETGRPDETPEGQLGNETVVPAAPQ